MPVHGIPGAEDAAAGEPGRVGMVDRPESGAVDLHLESVVPDKVTDASVSPSGNIYLLTHAQIYECVKCLDKDADAELKPVRSAPPRHLESLIAILRWMNKEFGYGMRQREIGRSWLAYLAHDEVSFAPEQLAAPVDCDAPARRKLVDAVAAALWRKVKDDEIQVIAGRQNQRRRLRPPG